MTINNHPIRPDPPPPTHCPAWITGPGLDAIGLAGVHCWQERPCAEHEGEA